MKQLRAYCQDGIIVICTIHQPRSAIWSLFERVGLHSLDTTQMCMFVAMPRLLTTQSVSC